jgi:hypothetical protein
MNFNKNPNIDVNDIIENKAQKMEQKNLWF